MRTTIRLDDHLLAAVKKYAADSGRTLTSVIEDALRDTLARRSAQVKRAPVRLKTFRGDGVKPGVDLNDSAALLETMESRGADSHRPG